MPMNRVQFQQGMSLPEFMQRFGTEMQCAAALEAARWPQGFQCPRCGHAEHSALKSGSRKTFQATQPDFVNGRHGSGLVSFSEQRVVGKWRIGSFHIGL